MRLLLLGLALGCEASQVQVDVGEGIVLLASTDEAGRVEEAALLRSDETNVPLVRRKNGFLVSWRLPPGSLLGSDGEPIAETDLRFELASAQSEGCGRCLAPGVQAPQTMYRGDRCEPPAFAEVEVFDADGARIEQLQIAELARAEVRLAVPGACAHPRFEVAPLRPLDICPLLPEEAPVGTPEIALAEDGTLMGASAGWIWRVDPAGARTTAAVGPIGDVALLGALSGAPGRFVYGGTRNTVLLNGYQYFVVDDSLRLDQIPDDTLTSFRAQELTAVDESSFILRGVRHVGNFSPVVEPEIVGCRTTGETIDCETEPVEPSDCALDLPRIHAVEGGAVAIGAAFAFRSSEGVWRCDASTQYERVPTANGDVDWRRSSYAGVLGNTIFACGRILSTGEGALVRAPFPELMPGEDPTGRVTYSIIERGPQCYEVLTLPELPDRLLVVTTTGAIAIDETGTVTDRFDYQLRPIGGGDPLIPELEFFPAGAFSAGDWLASLAGYGFVRRRGPGQPILDVYAPEDFRDDTALVKDADGSIWWHRGGGEPRKISLSSEGCAGLRVASRRPRWSRGRTAPSWRREPAPASRASSATIARRPRCWSASSGTW
jgi:hypothetical protein